MIMISECKIEQGCVQLKQNAVSHTYGIINQELYNSDILKLLLHLILDFNQSNDGQEDQIQIVQWLIILQKYSQISCILLQEPGFGIYLKTQECVYLK
ncbi:unnamed protein product [Paramecium octaurelia]|uniref:Uncharacterized protein n=1 Tax=Paramecium octaurelia TaxID=43137 RepID=A0A8S1VK44_PAROT|nr:unnamed protein product [Paramecium octaurelia]